MHEHRSLHTPCSAHYSNGTLVDKRNGQKRMLGTCIIHVHCLWWKSLFTAMVRELVSEVRDENFSPNWHGFLRGRRREGAMLAQRCMAWHLNFSGKNLTTIRSRMRTPVRALTEKRVKRKMSTCSRQTSGWRGDQETERFSCRGTMDNSRSC